MRWRNVDLEKKPRGVAAVEMALLLPVFLTVLLGTLEATRLGTATQQLTNAAREACRVAVLPSQECPRLADHEVGRQHLLGAAETPEHRERVLVPTVSGQRPRHPPAGVGELHDS